jgi:uncharacterized protein YdeI (YjbR/CyaY-like superfamily)
MTAALSFNLDVTPAPLTLAIPAELTALFEESPTAEASFRNLNERDRRGFVRYVVEAKTDATRERRAAIVAMSLIGLAH